MIKVISQLLLLLLLEGWSAFGMNLAVNTLTLRENLNWISISCPVKAGSATNDVQSNVKFDCWLGKQYKNKIYHDYHISMFPLIESSIPGCTKLDDCLKVELKQEKTTIHVHVWSLQSCLIAKIPFRLELRQGNKLIDENSTNVFFGRKPEQPTDLHIVKEKYNVFTVEGFAKYSCHGDLQGLNYDMNYQLSGMECSTSRNKWNYCNITNLNNSKLKFSCPIPYQCSSSSELLCSSRISATILGTSNLGLPGKKSRKISALLAYSEQKPLGLKITDKSLNSFIVTFDSPVTCTSAYPQFQYKISYIRIEQTMSNWEYLDRKTCAEKTCNINLGGFEMNTHYNICLSYKNVFDFRPSYTDPICTSGWTAQLPCQVPEITNLTQIQLSEIHWTAGLYWKLLEDNCWNDEETLPASNHFYKIEIRNGNSSTTYRKSWNLNSSFDGLDDLNYDKKYTLTLSSCNSYGCRNGLKNVLFISKKADLTEIGDVNTKPTVTETILICVLSLLFLACSTILYLLVKKRKQRLRLNRMPSADNNEFMMEETFVENRTSLSYALTTECARAILQQQDDDSDNDKEDSGDSQCPPDHHVVQVDTRPLVSHRMSVPENSTLV